MMPIIYNRAIAMASRKLLKVLTSDCIIPRLRAETKEQAIDELLASLEKQGKLDDLAQARSDVMAREKQMSTGLTHGLAVPHAKTRGVSEMTVALGIKPEGIEFESLDGKPTHVIFLVLSRPDTMGPHLQCMAEISAICSKPDVRQSLLSSKKESEVLGIIQSS